MAIPTLSNASINTLPSPGSTSIFPNSTFNTAISSAFATFKTNGTATTVNFSSDTFIFRADGAIWDDTCSCWIPVDKTRREPGLHRNQF